MIDSDRPFLPDALTPLAHTAIYAELGADERLRYNQLHALYVNEQILFFEQAFAEPVLSALEGMGASTDLEQSLRRFRQDEAAHSIMFRDLDRTLAPELYHSSAFHFIRAPRAAWKMLRAAARQPRWFPMLPWLMLMLEERALHYGREILRQADTIDPRVVATHARHLRDEAHHVQWDQQIIDWLWPRTERSLRRLNATLFTWLVGEFFSVPRRGAVAVIHELTRHCPALEPRRNELTRAVVALADRPEFHASLYSRRIVPQTFRRFDRWPEFAGVGRALKAYAGSEAVS